MILDTSALMAIALGEPEAEHVAELMGNAEELGIGAPTLFECLMLAEARRERGAAVIEELLAEFEVEVLPFGPDEVEAAYAAWYRFGRGRHPAGLNFGDCMSYAAARRTNRPHFWPRVTPFPRPTSHSCASPPPLPLSPGWQGP